MYAFSIEDLRVVVEALNDYLQTGNINTFDKLTVIQVMLLEEVKKLYA
jgi:hypothetical protein